MKTLNWNSLNHFVKPISILLILFLISFPIVYINSPAFSHWIPTACFLLSLSLIATYSLPQLFNSELPEGIPLSLPSSSPTWINFCAYGLSFLLFLQIGARLSLPLQWEDHRHFSGVATEPLIYINPFTRTEHHSLTNLVSFLSAEIFGYSKFFIKLPALVFSLLLIGQLLHFGKKWLTPFTLLFVLAHLNANEFSLWFMHSMRGYILSMLITSALLFQAWEIINSVTSSKKLVGFGFLGFCCVFNHLFSTVFSVVLFFSLLSWSVLFRSNLSKTQMEGLRKIIKVYLFFILPFYACSVISQGLYLLRLGDLMQSGFPHLGDSTSLMMGFSFDWNLRLLIVIALAISYYGIKSFKSREVSFFSFIYIFYWFSIFFIILCVVALRVRLVESRFLLAFLIPTSLFLGEGILRVPKKKKLLLGGLLFLSFILVPFVSKKAVQQTQALATQHYETFILKVKDFLAKNPKSCLTFFGEPNLIYFTQSIYLRHQPIVGCKQTYHIYFETTPELPSTDLRQKKLGSEFAQFIYDGKNKTPVHQWEPGFRYKRLFDEENRYVFFRQLE